MPFLLYEKSGSSLRRVRKVSLGGKYGPLAKYVWASADPASTEPLKWHLSEPEMLELLGVDPDGHTLIVDLKPKAEGNVSLYRILDAWGYSYTAWTPLALRFESLFVDRKEEEPKRFKEKFPLPATEGDLIHEFLYLAGGTAKRGERQEWNWGPTGSVNAALLWPDALRYFVDAIMPVVKREPVIA